MFRVMSSSAQGVIDKHISSRYSRLETVQSFPFICVLVQPSCIRTYMRCMAKCTEMFRLDSCDRYWGRLFVKVASHLIVVSCFSTKYVLLEHRVIKEHIKANMIKILFCGGGEGFIISFIFRLQFSFNILFLNIPRESESL